MPAGVRPIPCKPWPDTISIIFLFSKSFPVTICFVELTVHFFLAAMALHNGDVVHSVFYLGKIWLLFRLVCSDVTQAKADVTISDFCG